MIIFIQFAGFSIEQKSDEILKKNNECLYETVTFDNNKAISKKRKYSQNRLRRNINIILIIKRKFARAKTKKKYVVDHCIKHT